MSAKQRGRKMLFFTLLPLLFGLTLWGVFSLSEADEARLAPGYQKGTLVESSSLRRNNIYDRNFETLAVSFRLSSLYARPLEVNDPETTAAEVARLLDLDRQHLLDSLRSERSFVWLSRQVKKEVADEVLGRGLPGIYAMPSSHRYYPHHDGAAHVVGFVKDEQGLAGIELSYDNILRGGISDIRLAAAGVPDRVTAGGGVHLVSTLDLALQRELEQRMQRVLRTADGSAAAALIMNVNTGEVLAMASLPGYDPNRFWAAGSEQRLNRAVMPQVHLGALGELFQRAAGETGGLAPAYHTNDGELPAGGEAWWYPLAPDVYASSGFGGSGRATGALAEDFLQLMGLCQASNLDLLEGRSLGPIMQVEELAADECRQLLMDRRAVVNGVSLLAAFSRLVNQGQPVEPHLIRGFWDGADFWPRQSAITAAAMPAGFNRQMLQELATTAGNQGQVAIYESLVVEARSSAEKLEIAMADNASLLSGQGLEHQEQAGAAAVERAAAPQRYQAVMLGMAPIEKPELAALVFVDRARLDLALPSPLAGVVRDLDQWVGRLEQAASPPAPAAILARKEALYHDWLGKQEAGDLQVHAATRRAPERMPDVTGLSLRKALQVLQPSGLRFQVRGSGRVVKQEPPPGTPLREVDEGVLELRVPGGEMMAAGS
ncbi:PASTA domain-containing protein [Desulfurivibrio alkaliphilus]|nr:PASTA domain-containing protein [Desulfurivibrio alkaliphilus]